jgi:HAD superfamily hydrolase (TIGR01509 family)
MMIRAILWDNDGVLVDTEHLYFRATQQVLATVGIALTEGIYIDLFLTRAIGAWHLAEAKGIPPDGIARLKAQRNALYLRSLGTNIKAIDGVGEVLEQLHETYLMGVVTSSHREPFEAIHRSTGFMKYFAFTLTSEDYTKYKPDPEPYRLAIERTSFRAEECIAIEDSWRGLTSATAARLRCIVVPRGFTRTGTFTGAYAVLNDVREIPAVIRGMKNHDS